MRKQKKKLIDLKTDWSNPFALDSMNDDTEKHRHQMNIPLITFN